MPAPTLTVYTLATCDTCRRAVKWLRAHDIAFVEKAIRDTPPSLAELRAMLAILGGDDAAPAETEKRALALKKFFNTSGVDYRAQKLGEKLPALSEADALALLAANGNLVKRPFALRPATKQNVAAGLVGFDEATWSAALTK